MSPKMVGPLCVLLGAGIGALVTPDDRGFGAKLGALSGLAGYVLGAAAAEAADR